MKTFLKILFGILLTVASLFVYALVLMYLWNWFISPLGVVKIGLWLAFGISMTIKFFTGYFNFGKSEETGLSYNLETICDIVAGLIIWGIGALVALGI